MNPPLGEVLAYYSRVAKRGLRDAPAAITRTGVIVGLIVAVVAAAVSAVLNDEFNFVSTALAALAGAIWVAVFAVGWRFAVAPLLLAAEDERTLEAEFERRLDETRRTLVPAVDALAESERERQRLQALADVQGPKRALIEQLRKSESLHPIALIWQSREHSDDEKARERREAVDAVRAWVSETRALLKEEAPQYGDQFGTKTQLPYYLPFLSKGKPRPLPRGIDVINYLNEARASLSSIIRQL